MSDYKDADEAMCMKCQMIHPFGRGCNSPEDLVPNVYARPPTQEENSYKQRFCAMVGEARKLLKMKLDERAPDFTPLIKFVSDMALFLMPEEHRCEGCGGAFKQVVGKEVVAKVGEIDHEFCKIECMGKWANEQVPNVSG